MSSTEIARQLGMNSGSVRVQLGAARRKGVVIDNPTIRKRGPSPEELAVMEASRALEALPPESLRIDELIHAEGIPRDDLARRCKLGVSAIQAHLDLVRQGRMRLAEARQAAGLQIVPERVDTTVSRGTVLGLLSEDMAPSAVARRTDWAVADVEALVPKPTRAVKVGDALSLEPPPIVQKRRGWRHHSFYFHSKDPGKS